MSEDLRLTFEGIARVKIESNFTVDGQGRSMTKA